MNPTLFNFQLQNSDLSLNDILFALLSVPTVEEEDEDTAEEHAVDIVLSEAETGRLGIAIVRYAEDAPGEELVGEGGDDLEDVLEILMLFFEEEQDYDEQDYGEQEQEGGGDVQEE